MSSPTRILLLDPNADDRALALLVLQREFPQLTVTEVGDAITFAQAFVAGDFDFVVTENVLGWSGGLEVLGAIKNRYPTCPVIMFTAGGSEQLAVDGIKAGLDDYVIKTPGQFYKGLPAAIRTVKARKESQVQELLREKRVDTLLNSLEVGLFKATLDGRILECNAAMLRLLKLDSLEALQRVTLPELCADGMGRKAFQQWMRENGGANRNHETQLRSNGALLWFAFRKTHIYTDDTTVVHSLMELADERHRREDSREGELTELRRSNEALSEFAHTSAHELKAPLRNIERYARLLAMDYRSRLDADGEEILGHLVDGSRGMQQIVDDLLGFANAQRDQPDLRATDCEQVIQGALEELKTIIMESGAKISRDPLPTVRGDASHLKRIFVNLLGNGIKFAGKSKPELHLSAVMSGSEWRFSVKDNGIGIPPSEMDRLFKPFQRLHTKEEYPGTGLGLALCRKLVERHSGRIWAESDGRSGTTVCFTIPQNPMD